MSERLGVADLPRGCVLAFLVGGPPVAESLGLFSVFVDFVDIVGNKSG